MKDQSSLLGWLFPFSFFLISLLFLGVGIVYSLFLPTVWFIHCLLSIFFFCNDGNKCDLDSRRRKCLPLLQWCHQHFMQLWNLWSVWFLFFLRVYVIKENVWTDFVPKPLHSPHCQDLCNPENATLCQIVVRRSHNREGMASCRLKT